MKKRYNHKIIAVILVFTMLFSVLQYTNIFAASETATVTVNYVYESNNAMVAQPYSAQISKGDSFVKSVAAPNLINYSVPIDIAEGLNDDIKYSEDADGNGVVEFNIASVTEDVVVTLYYVAGTAEYTVKHYYQNLENDEYGAPVVVTLTGDIDAYTEAVMQNKEGYVCKGVPEYTIAADGTTEVAIYYDRVYYTVVFDVSGGVNGPEPIYGKYETAYDVSEITEPTRAGYSFSGWSPLVTGTITGDVTYVAQWTPKENTSDYTVVIWGQNADDDEYSFLNSYQAWGTPGNSVTWNGDTLICQGNHTHSLERCYNLVCTKQEHNHIKSGCTSVCTHTHSAECYGSSTKSTPSSDDLTYFRSLTLENGYVYRYKRSEVLNSYDKYYLYFNGEWYESSSENITGSAVGSGTLKSDYIEYFDDYYYKYNAKLSCVHTHNDLCYNCGKEEHTHSIENGCYELTCNIVADPNHTHSSSCYMSYFHPGSGLWTYSHSDTVTITADGTTVLNVYFVRKQFTLTFIYNGSTVGTITDRWGKNIKSQFDSIETATKAKLDSDEALAGWRDSTTGKYTNYVGIMPQTDKTFTANIEDSDENLNTMTYYFADLQGVYQEGFKIQFRGTGYTVTSDEYYEILGFTVNKSKSTSTGKGCNGAKFYYDRNEYDLKFYSASNSTPDKAETPLYQENIGKYDYIPTAKPETVEDDAVFVGWYLNPQCTGEKFELSAHTMPANNLALYAKWQNRSYTVTTYTDADFETLYKYEGYTGSQSVVKYTTAVEPTDPTPPDGKAFVGWFYLDNGVEKPFSFTMPITKDYNLYPKYSDKVMLTYVVHYYKIGTEEKVADDRENTVLIGTTVTEKAKMGTELNLISNYNEFYPDKTSTSVRILQESQEIIFYYTEAKGVPYTVKYVDADTGLSIADDKVVTAENNAFSVVTETYVAVEGYTPQQYKITQELTFSTDASDNTITFYYDKVYATINYEVVGPAGCGTVDPSSERVWISGDAVGSTAAANDSFRFVGWYSDKECTNKVGGYYKFVPQKSGDAWTNVTYYAKFEYALTDLTIEKKGWDEADKDQTFLFQIQGEGVDLTVTVHGNGSATVCGLKVGGKYSVTELTDWSWRYNFSNVTTDLTKTDIDKGATVTLTSDADDNKIIFTNTRNNSSWLDFNDYKVNNFKSVNQ